MARLFKQWSKEGGKYVFNRDAWIEWKMRKASIKNIMKRMGFKNTTKKEDENGKGRNKDRRAKTRPTPYVID